MVDGSKLIQETLNTILPSYYELFLDNEVELPCIAYNEQNNYDYLDSDDTGFSYITYLVKVYAMSINELQQYSNEVDLALKNIGGRRISSQEAVIEGHIEKWLTYRFLAKEYYR